MRFYLKSTAAALCIATAGWLVGGGASVHAAPKAPAQVNVLPGMPPVQDAINLYSADAPGLLSATVKNFPSRVYVPNSKSDSVDIIDPKTYGIVGHFDLPKKVRKGRQGRLEPQHVVPSWDLKKLWVAQDLGDQLTEIDPATGKEGKTNYEFVDALPKKNAGLSYRIKTVAKDGSSVYSNVQNTRVEEAVLQYKLKQNPVHQSIEVEIISPSDVSLQASIYTAYGQKAFVQTTKLFSGVNLLSLSSQNLLPGLHRLVLETGNERKVISFVKE